MKQFRQYAFASIIAMLPTFATGNTIIKSGSVITGISDVIIDVSCLNSLANLYHEYITY